MKRFCASYNLSSTKCESREEAKQDREEKEVKEKGRQFQRRKQELRALIPVPFSGICLLLKTDEIYSGQWHLTPKITNNVQQTFAFLYISNTISFCLTKTLVSAWAFAGYPLLLLLTTPAASFSKYFEKSAARVVRRSNKDFCIQHLCFRSLLLGRPTGSSSSP